MAKLSKRAQAWRNVMVAAINAGLEQKLFGLGAGENNFQADSARRDGAFYSFVFDHDVPALGYVRDIGFGELSIHAALWPTWDVRDWLGASGAGYHAGDVVAHGWLERERGKWLQSGTGPKSTWTFTCRQSRLPRVIAAQVAPAGYADTGRVMM